jgi:hypothetical protein
MTDSSEDNVLNNKVRCVDCNEEMSPEDRKEGLYYIDRWCIKCVKAEDERSQSEDTLGDTVVTFRLPRYLIPAEEWREDMNFTRIDQMLKDLLKAGEDEDG